MPATANERYRQAIQDALNLTQSAYLATSEPAPHPTRWKRWLRRPYRKGDPAAFMRELHRLHIERRGRARS